jgi:integrase
MTNRKRIATFGRRPHTVKVFSEETASGKYCRCQWNVRGLVKTQSWPDTGTGRREAKAFGETLALELAGPKQLERRELTLGELWVLYSTAEFGGLRRKTVINYNESWRKWEIFAGRETTAISITRERVEEFAKALRKSGIAASQIVKHMKRVRLALEFAVDRGMIPPTKATTVRIRIGKDERSPETVEYEPEAALKIIKALDPNDARQWRAWVFFSIDHYCGPRSNALLHLQWDDVDERARTITWRAKWDKKGDDYEQPFPSQVLDALQVARQWRERQGYDGPWVLYSPRGDRSRCITYGGINWMLHEAEERAGVERVHMNAMHRFRRGAARNVLEATGGDAHAAMAYIGDKDLKYATKYLKPRNQRLREVADLLSGTGKPRQSNPEGATKPQPRAGAKR